MKSKLLTIVFIIQFGSFLYAQDSVSWTSGDNQLSLTAMPIYDEQSQLLITVSAILSDYSIGMRVDSLKGTHFDYPPFEFLIINNTLASQKIEVKRDSLGGTVSGWMQFKKLVSSETSIFLQVAFEYDREPPRNKDVQGSILEIPLIKNK